MKKEIAKIYHLIDVVASNIEFTDSEFGVISAALYKELPQRVEWTGWKGYRDTRYKCPNCKKPVRNDDHYCHRCGQRLIFPQVDFTPYVKGQAQETIIKWEDEDE